MRSLQILDSYATFQSQLFTLAHQYGSWLVASDMAWMCSNHRQLYSVPVLRFLLLPMGYLCPCTLYSILYGIYTLIDKDTLACDISFLNSQSIRDELLVSPYPVYSVYPVYPPSRLSGPLDALAKLTALS